MNPTTHPFGVASFSFHGALADGTVNVFTYLEACRYRYHLSTADIWSGLLGNDLSLALSPEFLGKVRRAMDERGLVCVNYHADGCHPWEDSAEARERHLELAWKHIAAGELLGARTIRIDTGGRDRHWSAEQFDHIAGAFRKFAKRAQDGGYLIGPETHWGATNHPDNMLELHSAVASPAYGILLHMGKDTATSPDEYDRLLAPIAVHTHIDQKTCQSRMPAALGILRAANYRGALSIEHHTGKNEFEEVGAQLAELARGLKLLEGAAGTYRGNPLLSAKDERSHN